MESIFARTRSREVTMSTMAIGRKTEDRAKANASSTMGSSMWESGSQGKGMDRVITSIGDATSTEANGRMT